MLRSPKTASDCDCRRFCANFLNLSDFLLYVNLIFVLIVYIPKPSQTRCWRSFPECGEPKTVGSQAGSDQLLRAAQNIKQRPVFTRATRARERSTLGSCNGLFSAGFPTGAQGSCFPPPDPTNQLPTSLNGQATRPPGGSIAHLQLFKSSTSYPSLQPAVHLR